MHELDGSAGGGQLVRTALSLSALTGEPFRMTGVRDERPQPGLKPQHLAAVEAVAGVCDADVEGLERGAGELTFRPGTLSGGDVEVDVGTAGSVALVFDAVLPLALALPAPLRVHARGGTHVKWAPTTDYHRLVKLPLLREYGLEASAWVTRHGFYPAGGGDATLSLSPSTLSTVELESRGRLRGLRARSVATEGLADAEVAERAAAALEEALAVPVERSVEYVEARSPGAALLLDAEYEDGRAGPNALGERGVPAEEVAATVAERYRAFDRSGAAVDEHLADQLMVLLAVAGGSVSIPRVTDHVESNAAVIRAFGGDLDVEAGDPPRLSSPGGL